MNDLVDGRVPPERRQRPDTRRREQHAAGHREVRHKAAFGLIVHRPQHKQAVETKCFLSRTTILLATVGRLIIAGKFATFHDGFYINHPDGHEERRHEGRCQDEAQHAE